MNVRWFKCLILGLGSGALFAQNPALEAHRHKLAQAHAWASKAEAQLQESANRLSDTICRCSGRLTLESGVPVSTTDQSSLSTIYFTPYNGNRIALWNGSTWDLYNFSEISLSLTGLLTSGRNHDIYLYNNSGTLTLTVGTAWSAGQVRLAAAAVINVQDAVWVNNQDKTKRLVGTIRAVSANATSDTSRLRYVYSYCNRIIRPLWVTDTTNSWSYTTATIRQANASTNNSIGAVHTAYAFPFDLMALSVAVGTSAQTLGSDIALESTTTSASTTRGGELGASIATPFIAYWGVLPTATNAGVATANWNENGNTGATQYGDANDTRVQSGLLGSLEN